MRVALVPAGAKRPLSPAAGQLPGLDEGGGDIMDDPQGDRDVHRSRRYAWTPPYLRQARVMGWPDLGSVCSMQCTGDESASPGGEDQAESQDDIEIERVRTPICQYILHVQ